ncbi:MAG: AAA family ATPase, partial [Granulosicoccaceae bacterium]
MHRSGATLRKSNDGTLPTLMQRARARFESFSAEKSTSSVRVPWLSEVALRALRLEQQPFAPPKGPQSYFVDQMIDNLLGAMEESLLQSDNLIVLAGEHNSGKTCSVAQIVHGLYDQTQLFMARGSATQSAEQIVRSMLGAFRSTTPSHVDDCLEQLTNYLAEGEERASQNLLVLEDADLLDRRELQLLLNHLDHLNDSLSNSLKLLFTSAAPAEQLFTGMHSDQISQGRVEEFRQPLLEDN